MTRVSWQEAVGIVWRYHRYLGAIDLPGRVDTDNTTFASSAELATALRRAEAAHGEYEKRTGQRDANWSDWYAEYRVREQAGKPLPL